MSDSKKNNSQDIPVSDTFSQSPNVPSFVRERVIANDGLDNSDLRLLQEMAIKSVNPEE